MEIKHSIIMICYNHEQYIRTALDSVLCEQIKPYEIIIGDDFSTDQTREIIEEYRIKYPKIIKPILNERNLGIFANVNNVIFRATGNIISLLSGDDWYKPKLLENMNQRIVELNLNPNSSKFILMPHTVIHQQDGSEQLLRNDPNIFRRYSAVGLIFRNEFQSRNVGLSRAIYDTWPKYSEDIGPWADRVHHIMFAQHIDKLVEMDFDGPVYRIGVGIATRTRREELNRSFFRALLRIQEHYIKGELKLNVLDRNYLEYLLACWSVSQQFSFRKFILVFKNAFRLLNMDFSGRTHLAKEFIYMLRRIASNYKHKLIKIR